MKNKRIITAIIILIAAVTSFTALAELMEISESKGLSAEYDTLIEEIAEKPIEAEKTDNFNKMLEAVEQSAENEDSYNEILYNYFYLKKVHNLTQDELDYVAGLIADGCDAETILELTYFWLDTSEGIDLVKKMYDCKDFYYKERAWHEYAFYRVTGYENEMTDEDYAYFKEQGIDREVINIADKISRRRVFTTKEILNKMVAGESLAEITYDVEHSKNRNFRDIKKKNNKLVDDKNIIKSKKLAELTGNYENMLHEMADEELNKKLEAAEEAANKSVIKFMKNEKLIKNNSDIANEKVFKEKIKEKGVSEEDIEKYIQQGCNYVDILNAAEYKNVKNTSLENAIKEVAVNE